MKNNLKQKGIFLRISAFFAAICLVLTALPVTGAREAINFLYCDTDCDGELTASDARAVLRFAVDLDSYSVAHLKICAAADKFTADHARYILRLVVGLEKTEITTVRVPVSDFSQYVNKAPERDIFDVPVPEAPPVNAPSDTFTFTVYGWGHGVGLSQYGALSLEDHGYTYDRILAHYYTGTEIKFIEEFPETVIYPTLLPDEETGKEVWQYVPRDTEELMVRMVYQEIYGVTKQGKYKEALKAMTLCIFTNLMSFDFEVESRWDVGVAYEGDYETIPDNLKILVKEVLGQYITVEGDNKPILAVYSGLAAGYTASAESVWGYPYSYLQPVKSHFDMENPIFIKQFTYTSDELKTLILGYDPDISLSEDPSEWLEILEHTASMDEGRGYVTKIRVGNRVLSGYNQFQFNLMKNKFVSSCFTVAYTP